MKKFLCLVIVAVTIMSLCPGASASNVNFTDVTETDWYYPYIEMLADRGLVKGTTDRTYSPDSQLMVDEFLAFALRTMGKDQPNADGYWAQNYIDEAIGLNLIETDEYQRYDVPISREKIAKIVVRAVDYAYEKYTDYESVFSDLDAASEKEYVLKAIELGVLAGYSDGTFRPQTTATRAEASAMVVRMIDPSYRVQLVGNVFFCPKLDLNENGYVKKEKSFDFAMEFIRRFRIVKKPDGTIMIKGYTPEVPDGQKLSVNISFFSDKGKYLKDGYYSTTTKFEEDLIPSVGEFEIDTTARASEVATIELNITVSTIEDNRYTATFSIYKDYTGKIKDFFIRKDNIKMIYIDYSLTEDIWGW